MFVFSGEITAITRNHLSLEETDIYDLQCCSAAELGICCIHVVKLVIHSKRLMTCLQSSVGSQSHDIRWQSHNIRLKIQNKISSPPVCHLRGVGRVWRMTRILGHCERWREKTSSSSSEHSLADTQLKSVLWQGVRDISKFWNINLNMNWREEDDWNQYISFMTQKKLILIIIFLFYDIILCPIIESFLKDGFIWFL